MAKLPVCLNIDDHTPFIHVYRYHVKDGLTKDGRALADLIPLDFLRRFCDIIEENGVRGKLSYVPAPGCRGDIIHGLTGVDDAALEAWKDETKLRLAGSFSFGAEMLTHHLAKNLLNGKWYDINEVAWSNTQTRGTLAPYIANAVRLLGNAGFHVTGVTSPWMFGRDAEDEYRAAIALAFREVCGANEAWYYLNSAVRWPVRCEPIPGFKVVSVFATVGDLFWRSIDTTEGGAAYIQSLADAFITEDGTGGRIVEVVDAGAPVILSTHWQSLFSNGTRAGLEALAIVCRRVNTLLSDRAEWLTFDELMRREEIVNE